jgi:hypothetical protein
MLKTGDLLAGYRPKILKQIKKGHTGFAQNQLWQSHVKTGPIVGPFLQAPVSVCERRRQVLGGMIDMHTHELIIKEVRFSISEKPRR